MTGQIQLNSKFGKAIFDIAKREDVSTIVEIGTWNGMGSTACIYESVKGTDKRLVSLEVDTEMCRFAQDLYKDVPNVEIILGHVTDEFVDPKTLDSCFFTDYSIETKLSWLNNDLSKIKKSKNVFDLIPKEIDFLILDGGEFTSLFEFHLLKDRSRIIAADDTRLPCIKNVVVRNEIIKSMTVLEDDQTDRNGFVIGQQNIL